MFGCSCVGLDLVWVVLVVYVYCGTDWLFAYGCDGVSGLAALCWLDVWDSRVFVCFCWTVVCLDCDVVLY